MIKSSRAVLWDMDGTLVDSAEDHFEAWRETLAQRNFFLARPDFAAYFGRRNDDIIRAHLGAGIADEEIARFSVAKEICFRGRIKKQGIRALPGVTAWLARLQEQGWRQAIASSAPRENVEAVLEALGLRGYFQGLVAAEDVHTAKPDPEVFLTAAARIGVPPSRCLVVEDAPAGIDGARRAGMKSVGLCVMHDSLPADIAVRSLEELSENAFDELVPGSTFQVPG